MKLNRLNIGISYCYSFWNLLQSFSFVKQVYESDANFLLVKVENADKTYHYLTQQNIVVRNRHKEASCANCLRITVGTAAENEDLIEKLNNFNAD